MSRRLPRTALALALAILSPCLLVSNVQATGPEPVATVLTIEPPAPLPLGQQATVIGRLTTDTGQPVADEHVTLFVDGVDQPQTKADEAKTDANGEASFHTPRNLAAGTYHLTAVFAGSGGMRPYLPSSATMELVVKPAVIEIHTVPAVSGVPFFLGGLIFTSGQDGIARVNVSHSGTYRLEVLPFETSVAGVHVDFERWGDEASVRYRKVEIPSTTRLDVGLAVSYLVHVTSMDVAGKPAAPDRITSITLKDNRGNTYSLGKDSSLWLQANYMRRGTNGPEATKVQYAIQSAIVDGSDVATKDQPFTSGPTEVGWQGGLAIASGVHLGYADGSVQFLPFGDQRALTGGSLAYQTSSVVGIISTPVPGSEYLGPVPTVLTLEPLKPAALGESATVVIRLATARGAPLAGQLVTLALADMSVLTARTDIGGRGTFHLPRDLEAGTYRLTPTFVGSRTLLPSNIATELVVEPAELEIQTVPALAGIGFYLKPQWATADGQRLASEARSSGGISFSSDEAGVARVNVTHSGTYDLQVVTVETAAPGIHGAFNRWGDDVFVPYREVLVPATTRLEVGFEMTYQVGLTFVDLAGQPVEPDRVTSVTMKSSLGDTFSLNKEQKSQLLWLQANRVMRQRYGLQATPIQYAFLSVMVDGSNTVNAEQQRFYAHPNDSWRARLLFYTARFAGRDALFGFPIGSGIHLEYPDGSMHPLPFGPHAEITVERLARGPYRVKVLGVLGISSPSPVALSRDQDVYLKVISYLDVAVAFLLSTCLGFGFLFAGRPQLLLALRSPASLLALIRHTLRQELSP